MSSQPPFLSLVSPSSAGTAGCLGVSSALNSPDWYVNQYSRDALYVVGQTRFDRHGVWLGLGTAGNGHCSRVGGAACSTSGLSAKQATLGYTYSVDKNFDIYSSVFTVRNAKSATYGIFPTLGTTAPGANYRGFGVGLLAVF